MATANVQLERKVHAGEARWEYYLPSHPGERGYVALPLAATKAAAVVAITTHIALRHQRHLHHVGNEKCACGQEPADTAAVVVPD